MHQLWCDRNPSLTDVSEQRIAKKKRYLLTSGKVPESELEEIKSEADQDENTRLRFGLSNMLQQLMFVLVCRCRHWMRCLTPQCNI